MSNFPHFEHADHGMTRFPPNVEQITVKRETGRTWLVARRNDVELRFPLTGGDCSHLAGLLTAAALDENRGVLKGRGEVSQSLAAADLSDTIPSQEPLKVVMDPESKAFLEEIASLENTIHVELAEHDAEIAGLKETVSCLQSAQAAREEQQRKRL
jgi:hypothetical protein